MFVVGQTTPEQSLDLVDNNLSEKTAGHRSVQVQTEHCYIHVCVMHMLVSKMLIAFSEFAILYKYLLVLDINEISVFLKHAFISISMDEMEDQEPSEEAGEVDAVHSDQQASSLLPSLAEKDRILSKRERKTVSFEPVSVNLPLTLSPSCHSLHD